MSVQPRPEHPRPDFQRDTFCNLNGTWQFAFDDADEGLREGWQKLGFRLERQIVVPFCFQCAASGIADEGFHPIMWYRRSFTVPQVMKNSRVLLRFGAVDYSCRVYVNGMAVGSHEGGYLPFALDITHVLAHGENDLCLRVEDGQDCAQPRGKQHWDSGLMGCWYTPASGIWQTVYLEAVGSEALQFLRITPDIDHRIAGFSLALESPVRGELSVEIAIARGEKRWECRTTISNSQRVEIPVSLILPGRHQLDLWSPQNPALYDAEISLCRDGRVVDHVRTYFGMRSIELRNGKILLNHQPLYQRLILD